MIKSKYLKSILTALQALKRRKSAPMVVIVAPSFTGKTTLISLLMNGKIVPYMSVAIGEKKFTTLTPCEYCFDERIDVEEKYAIKIFRKAYDFKAIHNQIIKVILDVFARNDYDVDDTLEALDDATIDKILEPAGGRYHLGEIKEQLNLDGLKEAIGTILNALNEADFEDKYKEKKTELKSKKPKADELRELVFDEIYESLQDEKADYIAWLDGIGTIVEERLKTTVGELLCNGEMLQYDVETDEGQKILRELFNPFSPFSLLIDYMSLACRPRKEVVDIAKQKYPDLPFRICFRDTMGINQSGEEALDPTKIKESLEIALNCKADAVLYLMNLEEDDVTLEACGRALSEKQEALRDNGNLNVKFHIYYTKADRKIENIISNKKDGKLYIDLDTYKENIGEALNIVEDMIQRYSQDIASEDVSWGSMRFVKDSYIVDAIDEADPRRKFFEPRGVFERMVDISMSTLLNTLPSDANPIFVDAIDPDAPAINVEIDKARVMSVISQIQESLANTKDIVNGYTISNSTPRIHGRSVNLYWNRLGVGLGYRTNAHVYGNFNINMKGLIKRVINDNFASFDVFDNQHAVSFKAKNLDDNIFKEAMQELFGEGDLATGMNPALGDKAINEQRLYEYYCKFFKDPERYASLVDKVAYSLSYGNPEVRDLLHKIYFGTEGYDPAIRRLQETFKAFFGSAEFADILVSEFEKNISEMVNKLFIVL